MDSGSTYMHSNTAQFNSNINDGHIRQHTMAKALNDDDGHTESNAL